MQKEEQNWMVIRTFNRHEMMISEFLKKEGLTSFIPMQYVEKQNTSDQKPRRVLAPVIHNYVFVELSMPMKQFSALLAKCATPLYILKIKDTDQPVEIPNHEMQLLLFLPDCMLSGLFKMLKNFPLVSSCLR